IARVAHLGVAVLDRGDRAEHDMRLDAVAVHVGETQLGDGRTALGLVLDAAAIERVEERQLRPRNGLAVEPAAPAAPDLALAHPDETPVALFDMRCAVAELRRQALGPKIGRQVVEVDMVVAGNEAVIHGVNPSGRKCMMNQYPRRLPVKRPEKNGPRPWVRSSRSEASSL